MAKARGITRQQTLREFLLEEIPPSVAYTVVPEKGGFKATVQRFGAQGKQFGEWFTTVGQQRKATEAAISTIQYTLNTHQTELHGLHTEIKTTADTLGRQMQSSLQAHQAEISSDFGARFDQLERLPSKKHKSADGMAD